MGQEILYIDYFLKSQGGRPPALRSHTYLENTEMLFVNDL